MTFLSGHEPEPRSPQSGSSLAGLNVLVVEDSGVQRAHAVSLVTERGAAQVLEASDGIEGLAALAEGGGIDLVLSDLDMPRMDGIAFIGELAARGFRPKVIIISSQEAEVLQSVRMMAETYGLSVPGVIPKPLTSLVLEKVLSAPPRLVPALGPSAPSARQEVTPGEIRRGLEAKEFHCFFQPQVTFQGALFRGVEALARWRHPVFGLLGPAAFLPQAEADEELMSGLTLAILERVAEHWRIWKRRGLSLDVSVNLSARSLGIQGFSDHLMDAANRFELPPRALIFEVTESASTTHLGHTLANLARLRMRGYRLSIDDFGTGFATFEQLERIPFTELKIDQSIIRLLPMAERQMFMTRRIVQMAQDLKLSVVAEGIETLASWNALRHLGCKLGQGYFIARPMPAEQVAGWAKQDRSHLRGQELS